MKLFSTILFHLLILVSLNAQNGQTITGDSHDPDYITDFRYKVNGPVRTILETSYIIDDNRKIIKKGWDVSWESDSKLYFDKSGNITKVDDLMEDGSVSRSDLYQYLHGRLVHRRVNFTDYVYIYNGAGQLDEEYQEVTLPKVNTTGNTQPIPAAYTSKLKYAYNPNGTISTITETGLDGTVGGEVTFHYRQGSTELSKITASYDDVIETYAYTYTDGNITTIQLSDNEEGLYETYDYTFRDGQLAEENSKFYQDGQYVGDLVYKFENYNEVEVHESDEYGNLDYRTIYTYDFDDRGNWIRKYFTEKDKNYMVKREIVYWE